jgi:hypothetical protein
LSNTRSCSGVVRNDAFPDRAGCGGEVTKRYRERLEEVALARSSGGAVSEPSPVSFRWRGSTYEVVRVLGHWREEPGWWRRSDGSAIRIEQADLWRVEARNGVPSRGGGVYELVRRGGEWHLDRVWD